MSVIEVTELEQYRGGLVRHCRRVLGSPSEAEDAVQETFLRAWRNLDRFEGRSAVRSWLYRIATNVCLDMRDSAQRRPVLAEVEPLLPPGGDDPAETAVANEAVRLAFLVALRRLPRRQRAVVVLRDVLRWRAAEVAELFGTTVAAINSAHQRARAAIAASGGPGGPIDADERVTLDKLVDAFESYDVKSLVSLVA